MIPTTCVDDFYSNPDKIRDWALSLEYHSPSNGNFPGERSHHLSILDKEFYDQFCKKLFSIFYDYITPVNWVCDTAFQKIRPYHKDLNNLLNTGWAHLDNNCVFAGVIYLNKFSHPNSGTSILTPNHKFSSEYEPDWSYRNNLYNNGKFSEEEYCKKNQQHNEKFDISVDIKNKYNRLICYNGSTWHKESNFCTNEEYRLTQVFFIKTLEAHTFPLKRISNNYFL
jgi:hypothetical protein